MISGRRVMRARYWGYLGLAMAGLAAICGYGVLWASLPAERGAYQLAGLTAPVTVDFDAYGIPSIAAQSREEAFHALGFVTARERLFQMDLLRRQMAGRLAEVLGADVLESDRHHRILGFAGVADAIFRGLPTSQRAVLVAYAAGVNQAMTALPALPFEFWLLDYHPAPWRPEDSLLVILAMAEDLGWTADSERMATLMEAALPKTVHAFLAPALDHYTEQLLHGRQSSPAPIPTAELSALVRHNPGQRAAVVDPPVQGSNGWVVAATKTWDGRAMLANDMHLSLRVPNIWYRATLRYGNTRLDGLTLPGVPLLVSGSNGAVAWGFTNIEGDFVDLVTLETDPHDASRYRTPEGFRALGERVETIAVRDGSAETLKVPLSLWGPVLPKPLLGQRVAVHWTALDPAATDLGLLDLDSAETVSAALDIVNRAGGPPLNALVADRQGHIGWSYTGRIPQRFGLDGAVSRSWAEGTRGWRGYIPPQALPRLENPPQGFIVNANQKMVDEHYPHVIGHHFANGHRAHRIATKLAQGQAFNEQDMLALQLDTRAEFYRFYQRLALDLPEEGPPPDWRRALHSWNGAADADSLGFALLVEFRHLLLDAVIAPYLAPCRAMDAEFVWESADIDEPLQHILREQPPELLPQPERHPDWNSFLRALLAEAEHRVAAGATWGASNRVTIAHPFSESLPWAATLLNMPDEPVAGCPQCVRVHLPSQPNHGASERLVVAPGHENNASLHMPGGQSGHPLSPHYADQQTAWVTGERLPLIAGPARHRLDLLPAPEPAP